MKIPDATTISRTCLPASMKDVSICETYKKGPYVMPDLRRVHTVYPYKTRVYDKEMPQSHTTDQTIGKLRKMAKIRKRYNQVPNLTHDTTRESNKNTINITTKIQRADQPALSSLARWLPN